MNVGNAIFRRLPAGNSRAVGLVRVDNVPQDHVDGGRGGGEGGWSWVMNGLRISSLVLGKVDGGCISQGGLNYALQKGGHD